MSVVSVEVREVRLVNPFSLDEFLSGLPRPKVLQWLPPIINSEIAKTIIASEVPIDNREIVEWMHEAAANLAVLDVFAQTVESNRGRVVFTSGDPYIPGVRDSQWYVRSEPGSVVSTRGYGVVVTPYGEVQVPIGKRTIVFRDVLAWASITHVSPLQWVINLIRFDELPKTPITSKINFPNTGGFVAPVFVSVSTRIPSPFAILRVGMTTDKHQTVVLRGRSAGDYTRVVFEESISVDGGENEFILSVFGFPIVPQFVLELQPEDRTTSALNYLEVFP